MNFCGLMSEISNLYVLKVLSEKIPEIIFEYKKTILNNKYVLNLSVTNELNKLKKLKEKEEISEKKNNENFNLILPHLLNEIKENNEEEEIIIIRKILEDLILIKENLIESTNDLNKIFNYSFQFLKDEKGNKIKINLELIQIEQFRQILSDNFFSVLFILISKKKITELKKLIREIQDNPLNCSKEETMKFIYLIENNISKKREKEKKLVNEFEQKMNNGEIISINENLSNNHNIDNINKDKIIKPNIIVKEENVKFFENKINNNNIFNKNILNNNILNKNILISNNNNLHIQNKNNNLKENYDIDQWVNYIEDDDKKKKSKKKKHKKCKNKNINNNNNDNNNNKNNIINNNNDNNEINEEEKEIEIIKNSLLKNSCYKYSIRKLRPNISQEWIEKIKV